MQNQKIFIVTCDKLRYFGTFHTFDEIIDFLSLKNNVEFDGESFSIFGRGMEQDDEGDWIDSAYYIDSVVLSPKNKPTEYYTFFIRCIDLEGNRIELN